MWLYKYYGDLATMRASFNATKQYIELLDNADPGRINGGEVAVGVRAES